MTTPISYKVAFGTYEDALRMVGVTSEPRTAGTAVSAARIQMFAATVRDGNPSYWDAEFAARTWGGLLAPPGLLMGWLTPPPWEPPGRPSGWAIALRGPRPGPAPHHIYQCGQRGRVSAAHRRGRPAYRRRGSGVGVTGEAHQARCRPFRR